MSFNAPLVFGLAKAISRKQTVVEDCDSLILDFTDVQLLGVSASLALEELILEGRDRGRSIFIVAANDDICTRLNKLGLKDAVGRDHMVMTRVEALRKAASLAENSPHTAPDAPETAGTDY